MRALILSLLLLLCASAAPAQPAPVRVLLETSEGNITLELDLARAPITAANFLRYLDQRRYDGATFYRAMPGGPGRGLIQAGVDPDGYAVFGRIVDGRDTVRRIHAAPTSPTEGEGSMRGQMLSPRIRILSARLIR